MLNILPVVLILVFVAINVAVFVAVSLSYPLKCALKRLVRRDRRATRVPAWIASRSRVRADQTGTACEQDTTQGVHVRSVSTTGNQDTRGIAEPPPRSQATVSPLTAPNDQANLNGARRIANKTRKPLGRPCATSIEIST